jgi:hypothetical protein
MLIAPTSPIPDDVLAALRTAAGVTSVHALRG